MATYLYEVPINGTRPPERRCIIKETSKLYILDGIVDTHVRKNTMCNRFLRWFTTEETANEYYATIR